jgi:hypothetical protein
MPSTDFLPFATGAGANVESQSSYAGSGAQTLGFSSGLAQSAVVNKAIRQAAFIAAVIAQFEVNQLGINIPDDGNLANAITNFASSIWKNAALTGIPTGPTPATGDNSTKLSTTAYVIAELLAVLGSSPALGGNPTATTPGSGDTSTRIATTAFVQPLIAAALAAAESYASGLLGSFILNGNNPGYFQIPAIGSFPGLIINFGATGANTAGVVVDFAQPFPNAGLAAWISPSGSSSSITGISIANTSQAVLYTNVGTAGVWWFALGF